MRRFAPPLAALAVAALACASHRAQLLYTSRSAYNDIIVAEEEPGVRTLRFEAGGATQSKVRLGYPLDLQLGYTRAAMAALAAVDEPRRVLVIGLGGGSMPAFLRKVLPRASIDVVELDPEVAHVARRWFGFREDAAMRVHVDDGRRFIERSENAWDLVFLDAYGRDNIPRALATQEFLRSVRAHVAPGGAAVGNVWAGESNLLYASMRRTWQSALEPLCELPVRDTGNRIFLARPGAKEPLPPDFVARAARIAREHALPFDLAGYARAGCLPEPPDFADVLHDER